MLCLTTSRADALLIPGGRASPESVLLSMYSALCARNPPVPQQGSNTRSPIFGAITRTIARITSRGVKNCPASEPFSPIFRSRPS